VLGRVAEPEKACWRKHLLGVANRTIGYALAGLVSAAATEQQSRTTLLFGVGMGVAIGAISFLLESVERWLVLFDVPIR
jgi:hypothetical protein